MDYLRQNYRIYPSKTQAAILNQWIGSCRFIWNHMLAKNIEKYKQEQKFIFKFDMC
jgi:transposase